MSWAASTALVRSISRAPERWRTASAHAWPDSSAQPAKRVDIPQRMEQRIGGAWLPCGLGPLVRAQVEPLGARAPALGDRVDGLAGPVLAGLRPGLSEAQVAALASKKGVALPKALDAAQRGGVADLVQRSGRDFDALVAQDWKQRFEGGAGVTVAEIA